MARSVSWAEYGECRVFGGTQIVFISDPHVEFGGVKALPKWVLYPRMIARDAQKLVVCVTGDVGLPNHTRELLRHWCSVAEEVWFVPGNHDTAYDALTDAVSSGDYERSLMGSVFEAGDEDEMAKAHTERLEVFMDEDMRVGRENFRLLFECGIRVNGQIFYGHSLSFDPAGRRDGKYNAMTVGLDVYREALMNIPSGSGTILLTHKPPELGDGGIVTDIDSGNNEKNDGKKQTRRVRKAFFRCKRGEYFDNFEEMLRIMNEEDRPAKKQRIASDSDDESEYIHLKKRAKPYHPAIISMGIELLSIFLDEKRPNVQMCVFGHIHRTGGEVSQWPQLGSHKSRRLRVAVNASVWSCDRHPPWMLESDPWDVQCVETRVRDARARMSNAVTMSFPDENNPEVIVIDRWRSSEFNYCTNLPVYFRGKTQHLTTQKISLQQSEDVVKEN